MCVFLKPFGGDAYQQTEIHGGAFKASGLHVQGG